MSIRFEDNEAVIIKASDRKRIGIVAALKEWASQRLASGEARYISAKDEAGNPHAIDGVGCLKGVWKVVKTSGDSIIVVEPTIGYGRRLGY